MCSRAVSLVKGASNRKNTRGIFMNRYVPRVHHGTRVPQLTATVYRARAEPALPRPRS